MQGDHYTRISEARGAQSSQNSIWEALDIPDLQLSQPTGDYSNLHGAISSIGGSSKSGHQLQLGYSCGFFFLILTSEACILKRFSCVSYSNSVEFEYYVSIKTFKWRGAVWWRGSNRVRDFKWKKKKKKKTLNMNPPCPFTSKMSKLGFREGKWVPWLYSLSVEGPELKHHLNTQHHLRPLSPGLLYTRTSAALKWQDHSSRLNLLGVASGTNSRFWRDSTGPSLLRQ